MGEKLMDQDVQKKLVGFETTNKNNVEAILQYARGLAPTLRDAGRNHAAEGLERLLVAHDAELEEQGRWMREHGEDLVRVMMSEIEKRGRG